MQNCKLFAHKPVCPRLCFNPSLLTRPAVHASPAPRWWQMSRVLCRLETLKLCIWIRIIAIIVWDGRIKFLVSDCSLQAGAS